MAKSSSPSKLAGTPAHTQKITLNQVIDYLASLLSGHLATKEGKIKTDIKQEDLDDTTRHTVYAYLETPDKRISNIHAVGDIFLTADRAVRILTRLVMPSISQVPQFNNWTTVDYGQELAFMPHS